MKFPRFGFDRKHTGKRPKQSLSRWKQWLVLATLLVGLVQKIGEVIPTVAHLIATATNDSSPVTLAQLESLRTKPQW
jgi:hypothetical protein